MIAWQILFSTDSFVFIKGKTFGSMQELEQLRFAGRVWEAICGFLFSQQGRGAERESAPADSAVQTIAQRDSIKPKSPRRKRGLFACWSSRHAETKVIVELETPQSGALNVSIKPTRSYSSCSKKYF